MGVSIIGSIMSDANSGAAFNDTGTDYIFRESIISPKDPTWYVLNAESGVANNTPAFN